MKAFKSLLLVLSILLFSQSYSQSYVGLVADNYAGVHAVAFNPSSIVGSNYRADINVASLSSFGGSDYFGVRFSSLFNSGFDFDDDAERFLSENNNFFLNADVLGPSFMFNIDKKNSIGVITRARAFFNLNEFNGELFEAIEDDFESDTDVVFDSENLNGTIHGWAEIGIAYGRILMDKPNHVMKGGITLKYLLGAGALFAESPGLNGTYLRASETLVTQGNVNYNFTPGFDEDFDKSNLTSGFGMDLGFTYQWHPNRESDSIPMYRDKYKLKVGVSVTDIGSIKYENAEFNSYDMNAVVDASTFEDLEEFLDDNYQNTQSFKDVTIKLPTALRVLIDYRITNKFLVSANTTLSMVKRENELANSVNNSLTLTPRFETKWFSFFTPVSIRQFDDFAVGGGFRFGPLTVGSGSIFTNLISDRSRTADAFVALKIPLYRK
ncbi:DUF5723 family protein [Psychroserpens jangbogonensis]|uniref:DUF5723 family protein n=1 Tax=Psychroserpens jangbogonensis TaxID=1484460 RepID=UPI00053EF57F|nr:DUF5723 family protein [Psychroserpens jangbogonensis]